MKRNPPAAVLIGVPGMPAGQVVTTCDRCKDRYEIQLSTAMTLTQAGAARPPVYCVACSKTLGLLDNAEVTGTAEARRRLGLDN